jgi:hypothetical protein
VQLLGSNSFKMKIVALAAGILILGVERKLVMSVSVCYHLNTI